ncbi:hypothetical protein SAMN04489760_14218 [Syntrophus gentianae]|uniref:Uncharacterized protein n=1 Tax=Syntrophus gentianae TaxID=43775 RepID=A0A1H8AWV8_9BACT|nr:collagen-like protein [Syntrophus gentianae]SEM75220.1 hypothetical protein SAMN04489760_14218 [Syntrophus gentianae]
MADEQFITTNTEVSILTETPSEAQLVETTAEETYSFSTTESPVSLIETEAPGDVILETEDPDPQIIQIETTGPQGAPGEKGEKGDKGDPGDPGLVPGTAEGDFLRYDLETGSWIPGGAAATMAELKADPDIADALARRHSNSLDHAQGTDQYLDYGGSNQVTAAQVKNSVSNSHVPGSDNQDLSGYMTKASNLSDLASVATARTNLGVLTLSEVKSDADIADGLSKRHSNSLDHTQGTDQYMDFGGSNQVTATQVKSAVSNSHAPGSDNQDLSGLMAKSANLSDVADAATARSNINVPTLTEVKADADISDALSRRHSNSLDHTQGTDQYLDCGGSNQVTAVQVKSAVSNAHAPGSDNQDLSGYATKNEVAAIGGAAGHSQGIAMGYSASLGGIQVPYNASYDVGAHDFTITWRGSLPAWTMSSSQWLLYNKSGSSGAYVGLGLYISTTNIIQLYLYRSDSGTAFSFGTEDFDDFSTHEITIAVTRETVAAAGSAVCYVDGLQWGEAQEIPAASTASLSASASLYISGSDGSRNTSITNKVAVFNKALSAAEVYAIYCNGVDYANLQGSNSSVYASDFSSGTDSWTPTRGTRTGNVDGIAGVSDCLSFYASSDANTSHYIARSGTLIPYMYYKVILDYYIPSGNTNLDGIRVGGTGTANALRATGSWVTDAESIIFTTTATSLIIMAEANFNSSFTGAGSTSDDLFYVKNIRVFPVGACLLLEPDGIQPAPGQWLDSSINGNHGRHTSSHSRTTIKGNSFEIRWVCTWSGTHEAQYIGGINQAILPSDCYITEIIGVITGAVINDIILGDGSDTDRWVAITSGLATGTVSFTPANRVSDGTNYKLVVDPDANFTGSIAFTIRGIILET